MQIYLRTDNTINDVGISNLCILFMQRLCIITLFMQGVIQRVTYTANTLPRFAQMLKKYLKKMPKIVSLPTQLHILTYICTYTH